MKRAAADVLAPLFSYRGWYPQDNLAWIKEWRVSMPDFHILKNEIGKDNQAPGQGRCCYDNDRTTLLPILKKKAHTHY